MKIGDVVVYGSKECIVKSKNEVEVGMGSHSSMMTAYDLLRLEDGKVIPGVLEYDCIDIKSYISMTEVTDIIQYVQDRIKGLNTVSLIKDPVEALSHSAGSLKDVADIIGRNSSNKDKEYYDRLLDILIRSISNVTNVAYQLRDELINIRVNEVVKSANEKVNKWNP